MKTKKILSFMLSFALIFTTVFAGTGSAFAAEKGFAPAAVSVKNSELEAAPMSAVTMKFSTTELPDYQQYQVPAGGYVGIIPVTAADTGWLYLDVNAAVENDTGAKVFLVDQYQYDPATGQISIATEEIQNYWYASAGEERLNAKKILVNKGQTCYVLVQSGAYAEVNPTVYLRARVYTTEQRTLSASSSKWTIVSGMNKEGEYGKATWFKVKPSKSGLMKVYLQEYGYESTYGNVTLYNADKKAVSEKISYSSSGNNELCFGVKKGRTYYLKVENFYGSSTESNAYGVRYTISGMTDKAYSSKSKAKVLKRKASSTANLFTASTGTATDWYKINVSAKRKTEIKINASWIESGYLTVTVYKGSKKVGTGKVYAGNSNTFQITYGTTYGKANKGTYYIKVVKSKKANGKYTIQYKQ